MSAKLRVMYFEADGVSDATIGQILDTIARQAGATVINPPTPAQLAELRAAADRMPPSPIVSLPAPTESPAPVDAPPADEPRPRKLKGRRKLPPPRKGHAYVCDDFPGRTFTSKEVRELCDLSPVTALTQYVRDQKPVGKTKYVFRVAGGETPTAAAASNDDGGGGDDEPGGAGEQPAAEGNAIAEDDDYDPSDPPAEVRREHDEIDAEARATEAAQPPRPRRRREASNFKANAAGIIPRYDLGGARTRGEAAGDDLMPVNGNRLGAAPDAPSLVRFDEKLN